MAELIQEFNRSGLPEHASRRSIQRAREEFLSISSGYGAVFRQMPLQLQDPDEQVNMWYIHPAAALSYAVKQCPEFAEFLKSAAEKQPPSPSNKWDIVVYNDEVTPGDALKGTNLKKFQAIYWSFKQFGVAALSTETLWFTLCAVRSTYVQRTPGGMSFIYARLIETFFQHGANFFDEGINLVLDALLVVFFAKIGISLADGDAHRANIGVVGASGILLCPFCQNCVAPKSDRAGRGSAASGSRVELVESTCTDLQAYVHHTDDSLLANAEYLERQAGTVTKTKLREMSTNLGVRHIRGGLLLSLSLRIFMQALSSCMLDWMHIYVASAIFQIEVGRMMKHCPSLRSELYAELEKWTWPRRLFGNTLRNVFKKKKENFTCAASEALNLFLVIRHHITYKSASSALEQLAFQSFSLLCDVLLLLVKVLRLLDDSCVRWSMLMMTTMITMVR